MLCKEEAKELKTEFFEVFKQKMQRYKSQGGFRVNWINYPLRLKNFYCRIILEPGYCGLVIDIQEKDESLRQLFAEQWEELRKVLSDQMGQTVEIDSDHTMFTGVKAVRVTLFEDQIVWYHKDNWPKIHDNLCKNLTSFDVFWQDFDDVFKGLVNR